MIRSMRPCGGASSGNSAHTQEHDMSNEKCWMVTRFSSVDVSQRETLGTFDSESEARAFRDANSVDEFGNVSHDRDCDYLVVEKDTEA
jgi:hypothetical protein